MADRPPPSSNPSGPGRPQNPYDPTQGPPPAGVAPGYRPQPGPAGTLGVGTGGGGGSDGGGGGVPTNWLSRLFGGGGQGGSTTGFNWGGLAGGLVGGLGSYFGAREQNAAQRDSGQVDITHQTLPYDGSMPYRQAGVDRAYDLLYGPGTAAAPPPSGPQSTSLPAGSRKPAVGVGRFNAKGEWVPAAGAGTGGAGGAPVPAAYAGESPETAQAIAAALRMAGGIENSPVTQAAQSYTAGTLGGKDQNPYRQETADMLRQGSDSDYRRYLDMLFGSDTGLPGGGRGGGGGLGQYGPGTRINADGSAIGSRTPSAMASGPVGVDAVLKKILAGEDVPGAQAMRERIKHGADDAYNEAIRQRRLDASGSNMYGGSGQMADEAYATGKYGAGLADAYASQDYQLYGQALGLGTGYDTAALDRAAQERIANASLSASSGAQGAELASRERLARMGALGDAIGLGVSGMGSLSEGFSGDQRNAAGLAGDIAMLPQAGYLAAGGLSLGSDTARNQWQASKNQLAAANASTGLGRAQLAFDRERYGHQQPWQDVAAYQAIVSGAYDPFSSSHEYGQDQRGSSPNYASPGGQALSGALAGYYMGSDIYGRRSATG